VPTPHTYDYAVLRVVPRVERGEFVNAGIVLWCAGARFLGARIALDEAALKALDPHVDLGQVREALAAIERVCAGGAAAGALGRLSPRERFHWLVAPRSTTLQTSPVHTGRCSDPAAALEHLMAAMVRRPSSAHARSQPIP